MIKAREYALEAHGDQKYGFHPYSYHLDAVAGKVEVFKEHLNLEDQETAITLAYLHDTVEDTSTTLESIELNFGSRVAECVSLLTDSPGVNRKARKAATYARLSAVPEQDPHTLAHFVKACDRMANIEESQKTGNLRTLRMYVEEAEVFIHALEGKIPAPIMKAMKEQIQEASEILDNQKSRK